MINYNWYTSLFIFVLVFLYFFCGDLKACKNCVCSSPAKTGGAHCTDGRGRRPATPVGYRCHCDRPGIAPLRHHLWSHCG